MESIYLNFNIELSIYDIDEIIKSAFSSSLASWADAYEIEYNEKETITSNLHEVTQILLNNGKVIINDYDEEYKINEEQYTLTWDKLIEGIKKFIILYGINELKESIDLNSNTIIQYALFGDEFYDPI